MATMAVTQHVEVTAEEVAAHLNGYSTSTAAQTEIAAFRAQMNAQRFPAASRDAAAMHTPLRVRW